MKPTFALNLNPEGIGLVHRTIRGWSPVGEVPLDAPDMAEALAFLRSTALGLDVRGLTTKVILPISQVLFKEVTAPGPTTAQRRAQIAAALDGQTPYAIDELVFDWSGTGEVLQVAVVARETLEEAEAFALEHKFNPVSFVCTPEPGQFAGEPFFGTAPSAAELLKGDRVERDQDPVRVSRLPRPEQAPDPEAPMASVTAPMVIEETAVEETAAKEATAEDAAPGLDAELAVAETAAEAVVAADALSLPEPAADEVATPEPDEVIAEAIEPAAPEAAADDAEAVSLAREAAPEAEPADEHPAKVPAWDAAEPAAELPLTGQDSVALAALASAADDLSADPPPQPDVVEDEAPMAEMVDDAEPAAALLETADAPRPRPTFTTRRDPAVSPISDQPRPERPAPRIGAPPMADLPPAPPLRAVPAAGARAAAKPASMPEAVRTALAAQVARSGGTRSGKRPVAPPPPPKLAKAKANEADTGRFIPERPVPAEETIAALPAAAPTSQPQTEAEAMTVFGARRKDRPRRAPRFLGLILTVILLALLGAVALWSTVSVSEREPAAPATTQTATATPDATTPPVGAPAAPAPTPDAATQTAAAPATAAAADGTVSPTPQVTAPDSKAPAQPEANASIAVASVDPGLTLSPAATLPAGGPDTQPATPAPPPMPDAAAGQSAEPQQAAPQTSPASQPTQAVAALPPATPPVPAPAAAQPSAAAATVAEPPPGADPKLAKVHPKPPPASLYAAPVPAGSVAPTAATILPKPRPTTGVFAPPAPAAAPAAADSGSDLAVASSLRPKAPPKALIALQAKARTVAAKPTVVDSGVAAALAAAGATPVAAVQPAPQAQPVVDEAPAAVAPMPAIPQNPSVVREATVNSGLNLNRVSLIGVFGTSADRSALVRMPGGKVMRVQVGDTLDGGRVAAIGEDNLYYVKNGQNVMLAMPKG